MTLIKQAIILAAGQGQRLLPYTKDRPKCLIEIGGKSILEHQVEALQSQGVDRVMAVVGYRGEKVRDVLGTRAQYVENTRFTTTSSMYSLWLAREVGTDGCIILNSDVLFHVGILETLLKSPHPDALAVDFDAVLAEEETKVLVTGDRVQTLGKALSRGDGENVGMLKFSAKGGQALFDKVEKLLTQNHHLKMVPFAVDALAADSFVAAISVQGLPWLEIDFPEDYQRACDVIYPAICNMSYTSTLPHTESLAGLNSQEGR